MHHVTLIPGDGTGPEITEATRRCLEATGVKFDWDVQECGIEVIEKLGKVPESVLASVRKNQVALKGPITTPIGKGFRNVNVYLRQELGLYACLRPCKTYKGVRSFFSGVNVDLVIVRENTEDLYAGVEFQAGLPATAELIDFINSKATGRKSVTSVCKANIMKFTDGLWYDETRAVAAAYGAKFEQPELKVDPDAELAGKTTDASHVAYMERLIDNMCMQLVQKPEQYDVILLSNLYGDILSDLCAGLVGGLGVAPGANIGPSSAIFEATHGSAPKYKGQNKVNPTALILSGKLMLEHLGEKAAAEKLEAAVAAVIAEGKDVTYDMKPHRTDPTAVGTAQMADAIIAKMQSM
ncbi:MAG TPA: isocitrate/isopropylmalate family dehydrogenase [Planctomycetaceae bacterium]|nr:isocitrate/isopropylmalate family dehydrogenase [Planctomycetaceae bacterium]